MPYLYQQQNTPTLTDWHTMSSHSDPLMFDAVHLVTLQAVVGTKDSLVTTAQARDLLSVPSGTRPRMYGLVFEDDRYQVVKLSSVHNLDTLPLVAQWLSGTTLADLIGRA